MDLHNLIYERITRIVHPDTEELQLDNFSLSECPNDACSLCKRKITEQPPRYKDLAFIGQNSYKQKMIYCIPCSAFFKNNPQVMGIEKASAPKTGQKFGMAAGSGMFIEIEGNKNYLFMPPKSAEKLPESTLKLLASMNVELVQITQFNQLAFLSKQDLKFPAVWINNFGRKTDALIANIKASESPEAIYLVSDDSVNSSTEITLKINLTNLVNFADKYNPLKSKAKFKAAISNLSSGSISPKDMVQFLNENEDTKPLMSLLPRDPHLRVNFIRLAEKIG